MKLRRSALSRNAQDSAMFSVWRAQLAPTIPGVFQITVKRRPELLLAFAAYYTSLQELPRRARRRLPRQFRSRVTHRQAVRTAYLGGDGIEACDIGAFELTLCGGRIPTRVGTVRRDVINGTAGIDVIEGLSGNDTLNGLAGNDVLCGRFDNDALNGGAGIDTAAFAGIRRLVGVEGVAVNLAVGAAIGEGSDSLTGIENVTGSVGPDTITGDAGPNTLIGGGGTDVLNGAGGNDRLLGGTGDDAMNGGAGVDACNGQSGVNDTATACETVVGVP
ncbi:MAG: calcium-binding protein [Gammaproteobacteria bacterium]